MNNKKGISLIVLVITILVMIILAGVVIVSLQKNNPVQKANEAKLKDSVASVRGAISQYAVTNTADGEADIMKGLLTADEIKSGEYAGYKKLNYGAANLKSELGVDAKALESFGDFYVNPESGASVFRLKTAGTESEGIVNPTTAPLA